jgi:ATP-dependent DNA ligase
VSAQKKAAKKKTAKGTAKKTAKETGATKTSAAKGPPMPKAGELLPMEAQSVSEIPVGDAWQYEPKWDGFRCLAFRNGDDVQLMSKAGKPLSRYFPEMVRALLDLSPSTFILDGELIISVNDTISFDDLLLRIHPAESRINRLAAESPAMMIVFDLLAGDDGRSLVALPLAERRKALEHFASAHFTTRSPFRLSPATTSETTVRRWFAELRDGLDGVIAKRRDLPYAAGERSGMQKIKRMRTAECVVGGYRLASKGEVVGSLLLGLYDTEGLLHHVGFTANIPRSDRAALTKLLEKLRQKPGFTGRAPGGPSRWSTGRSAEWEPLAPKLVVEVQYDHFSGGRFRHGTSLLRWRPDKAPGQCRMSQVERESRTSLALLEGDATRRASGSGGDGGRRRNPSQASAPRSPATRPR